MKHNAEVGLFTKPFLFFLLVFVNRLMQRLDSQMNAVVFLNRNLLQDSEDIPVFEPACFLDLLTLDQIQTNLNSSRFVCLR